MILYSKWELSFYGPNVYEQHFSVNYVVHIYRWEKYQSMNISIGGQISISVISVISICSTYKPA